MSLGPDPTNGRLPPSQRVVRSVASVIDTDPLDLPLLYHAIDPDALDALVDALKIGTVRFRYAGVGVIVHSDGRIDVSGGLDERTGEDDAAAGD